MKLPRHPRGLYLKGHTIRLIANARVAADGRGRGRGGSLASRRLFSLTSPCGNTAPQLDGGRVDAAAGIVLDRRGARAPAAGILERAHRECLYAAGQRPAGPACVLGTPDTYPGRGHPSSRGALGSRRRLPLAAACRPCPRGRVPLVPATRRIERDPPTGARISAAVRRFSPAGQLPAVPALVPAIQSHAG